MDDIVIVSAARTPVGSFNGALSSVHAQQLGAIALQAAISRAGIEAADVDELIYGQVLAAGEGQNPTRQAARAAGYPIPQQHLASTRFAGPACAPSPLPPSKSAPEKARSSRPAEWRA